MQTALPPRAASSPASHGVTRRPEVIQSLVESQAQRRPHAIAVVCESERLTYAELNARANQLAHQLRAQNVGPETMVGIYMERSVRTVVGILGILKAGGCYVPI